MRFQDCLNLIEKDLERVARSRKAKLLKITVDPVSKLLCCYRLGAYFRTASRLWAPFVFINSVLYRHYKYKTGISIPYEAKLGGGIKVFHFQSIIVNGGVVAGKNLTLYQDVTIGASCPDTSMAVPKIGDNVVLCSGAKIIGDVTIGDNVIVASNAVVTHDVPSGSVVAGVPAKVIASNAAEKIRYWIAP